MLQILAQVDHLLEYLNGTPPLVRVLGEIGLLMLLLSVGLILLILIVKIGRSMRRNKEEVLINHYKPQLIKLLYAKDMGFTAAASNLEIELKNSNATKMVVRRLLLTMKRNIDGKVALKVAKIYQTTGLGTMIQKELFHWNWRVKVRALQEIREVELNCTVDIVKQLLNDRNNLVRSEAQLLVVQLDMKAGFDFLYTLRFRLSKWQQMKLLVVLQHYPKQLIPDFTNWIDSPNNSITIFAIELLGIYNKKEAVQSLEPCLEHKSQDVIVQTIRTLKVLKSVTSISKLEAMYPHSSNKVKKEIIAFMGDVGEESELGFLRSCLNEKNSHVGLEAATAITHILPNPVDYFKNILSEVKPKTRSILNQLIYKHQTNSHGFHK